ncbi:MAG: hypothetical protein IPM04_14545 [Saprospiraceae bacterium]|nr:hypothetical protein [Candidatus Brachybacter algidus]MBK8748998.1 hypothetical protein [Candidatus Brachybacter algidus]
MKAILFFFISIHFLTAQDLKLTDIQGRWYVIQSNFPVWLSGEKKQTQHLITPSWKGRAIPYYCMKLSI